MPKMRWCFTRFRHAARTARGGPKCVGASLGLGCAPPSPARTRLGAYATRCFRSWSWTKTLLLRAYATRCCARTRRVAARVRDAGVGRTRCGVFRAVYPKVCPPHVSVNRRNGASGRGGPKCVGASLSLRRPRLSDSRVKGLGGDRVSQLRAGALGAGPAASRKDGRVVLARSGGSGPGRGSPRPGRPVASRLRGGSGP